VGGRLRRLHGHLEPDRRLKWNGGIGCHNARVIYQIVPYGLSVSAVREEASPFGVHQPLCGCASHTYSVV
jgi:hypothetical protein